MFGGRRTRRPWCAPGRSWGASRPGRHPTPAGSTAARIPGPAEWPSTWVTRWGARRQSGARGRSSGGSPRRATHRRVTARCWTDPCGPPMWRARCAVGHPVPGRPAPFGWRRRGHGAQPHTTRQDGPPTPANTAPSRTTRRLTPRCVPRDRRPWSAAGCGASAPPPARVGDPPGPWCPVR